MEKLAKQVAVGITVVVMICLMVGLSSALIAWVLWIAWNNFAPMVWENAQMLVFYKTWAVVAILDIFYLLFFFKRKTY